MEDWRHGHHGHLKLVVADIAPELDIAYIPNMAAIPAPPATKQKKRTVMNALIVMVAAT